MQVHELAKLAGVESVEVMAFLGAKSHLTKVSDEDIARVTAKFELTETPSISASRDGIVRLWSDNRKHIIMATNGEQMILDDFQLTVRVDSDIYNEIKKSNDSEVRVVVDKPFATVSERTAFSKFLTDRCVTDQGKQSLHDGLDWVKALFYPSELVQVAELLQESAGLVGVIQLAVDTKSYKTL